MSMSYTEAGMLDRERSAPSCGCCIDLVHLSCITMGDKGLERDVLQAYAAQARPHREALLSGDDTRVTRAAHMLIGASKTIGARFVASRAEDCAREGGEAVPALLAALDDAVAFIGDLDD